MNEDNFKVKLSDASYEDDAVDSVANDGPVAPQYGRDGWQEYVLSHLREDERVKTSDGNIYPKCAGLRRLVELLIGDITFLGPTQVFVTNDVKEAGRATVVAEVRVCCTRLNNQPILFGNDNHGLPERVFASVADTWIGNTPAPYVNHTAATAESKALSRALKYALALNVHTAEEMTTNPAYSKVEARQIEDIVEEAAVEPPTKSQLAYLKNIAQELNISADKLIGKMFKGKKFNSETPSETLTKSQASEVIKQLNAYKNNSADAEEIPQDIKV